MSARSWLGLQGTDDPYGWILQGRDSADLDGTPGDGTCARRARMPEPLDVSSVALDGFGHGLVHLRAEGATLLATAGQSCNVRRWSENRVEAMRARAKHAGTPSP